VRVGTSQDEIGRSLAIGNWHPHGVEIVATLPGSFAREAMIHRIFAGQALGRDWFKASPLVWRVMLDAIDRRIDWLPAEPTKQEWVEVRKNMGPRIKAAFGGPSKMAKIAGYSAGHVSFACTPTNWNPPAGVYAALALQEADLRGELPSYLSDLWQERAVPRKTNRSVA
jgi:hypothetical protein